MATLVGLALALTSAAGSQEPPATAPLVVWNRTIHVFRAPYEQLAPAQRAAGARERITALPELGPWKIEWQATTVGERSGVLVLANGQPVFGILPEDLDPEGGETLEQAAEQAVERLGAMLAARAAQREGPLMLRAAGKALLATLAFLGACWAFARARRRLLERAERAGGVIARRIRQAEIGGAVRSVEVWLLRGIGWVGFGFLGYLWLTFVLKRFPYTEPWGQELGGFLLRLFRSLGLGILQALPGLFTVLVIFLVARAGTRAIGSLFHGVERGTVVLPWAHPDTAGATRRILVVAIWIFAFSVAYPHIPGSDTQAFKGISLLVGLMASLGAATLVGQLLSGLVVIYSRSLKKGEYVRIGEAEGTVQEVGVLSAKLVSRRREEITIPNAVIVGATTVNYSRLAGDDGAVVATTVTIGYGAPWRQVHALLRLAADRTTGVRKQPEPEILQRGLSDFYVEYELRVRIDHAEARYVVLSELHGHIQDAFNEFGVQIMAPSFEAQPDAPVVVPKAQWFAAPAAGQESDARKDES